MITKIEFTGGANFITAYGPDENVLIHCDSKYTDITDEMPLPVFIKLHGGNDECAQYLIDCYRSAMSIF